MIYLYWFGAVTGSIALAHVMYKMIRDEASELTLIVWMYGAIAAPVGFASIYFTHN